MNFEMRTLRTVASKRRSAAIARLGTPMFLIALGAQGLASWDGTERKSFRDHTLEYPLMIDHEKPGHRSSILDLLPQSRS